MKKINKNKLSKGSLLLAGFLFVFLSYFDFKIDKENISLLASNVNSIYTNVDANELLNILDNKTGVILIINDKLLIKKYVNILTNINNDENIYVYNSKNDEIILTKENDKIKVVQEQSEGYKKLVDRLGFYTELYILDETEFTNYYKINTPMVMFIKDGHIEFGYYHADENLTEEDLSNIYQMGFNKLKEN